MNLYPNKEPPFTFKALFPIFLGGEGVDGKHLQLSGYNRDLGLAFEYRGPHLHKSRRQFKEQQKDDETKERLCKDNGIHLIIVPHDEHIEELFKEELTRWEEAKSGIKNHYTKVAPESGIPWSIIGAITLGYCGYRDYECYHDEPENRSSDESEDELISQMEQGDQDITN